MTVKLMLLKTGETVISDAKEVVQEESVRGYLLKQPHYVRSQEKNVLMESDSEKANYELDVMLTPWMILSSDKDFVVTADYVATICEPISSIKDMYLKKTEETPLSETEVLND
tara:strand:+ start:61 stop:399 length:339 start_codon:yes stop_codon:yes gene_type:complete